MRPGWPPQRRQDTGRHAPLSGGSGALGSGHRSHRAVPVVIWHRDLASTHHGEGVKQELVQARPDRRHLRQRPIRSLHEAIVVRPDPRIVLQAGDRGQVQDCPEPGPPPSTQALPAPQGLPTVPAGGTRPGPRDERPTMAVIRDGPYVGEASGNAGPAPPRNCPQVPGLLEPRQPAVDLSGHLPQLRREGLEADDHPLDFARENVETIGAGHGLRRVAADLGEREAPPSPPCPVGPHSRDEVRERQPGDLHRGQAGG